MTVVLVTEGTPRASVRVVVSAMAELAACLHALTEADHHGALRQWRADLLDSLDASMRRRIERLSPLWAAYRARVLYPSGESAGESHTFADELAGLRRMDVAHFTRLTAYACAGGYTGLAVDRIASDAGQRDALLTAARAGSVERVELARALLDDPARFQADLADFLADCEAHFFAATWRDVEARVSVARDQYADRLAHEDLATALAAMSDTAEVHDGPRRVVVDKFHHSVVRVGDEGLVLVPSWYGWPHLTVKHEPGLTPVLQFPVSGRGRAMPRQALRRRLDALSDPGRLRICRLIVREPLSTTALAERTQMTSPQVSRHLRRLRDAGLVRAERDGRFVYYSLDVDEVARLGSDVLTALLQ